MIYLLEDDESIRKLVVYALGTQGFEAEGFGDPDSFRAAVKRRAPELVLLDIMLPGGDGITELKRIRSTPATARIPVILLTARDTAYDRVEGLDTGADDYITKPFGMMELAARIRALLRRTSGAPAQTEYRIGPLFLCPDRHEIRVGGEDVTLTYKEFTLLCYLCENRGIALTRAAIMDRIWGLEAEPENRTLDVHIRTLRSKLGEAGALIETIRGIGYRMRAEDV